MTWKKLAFSDEVMLADGSVSMTGSLFFTEGNRAIEVAGSTGALHLKSGDTLYDPYISMMGKDAAGDAGNMLFRVPNAAGTSGLLVAGIDGKNDAPTFEVYYGLGMNQKEISAMAFENLAAAPHSGTEVQGETYYNTADDHLHVWVV